MRNNLKKCSIYVLFVYTFIMIVSSYMNLSKLEILVLMYNVILKNQIIIGGKYHENSLELTFQLTLTLVPTWAYTLIQRKLSRYDHWSIEHKF